MLLYSRTMRLFGSCTRTVPYHARMLPDKHQWQLKVFLNTPSVTTLTLPRKSLGSLKLVVPQCVQKLRDPKIEHIMIMDIPLRVIRHQVCLPES